MIPVVILVLGNLYTKMQLNRFFSSNLNIQKRNLFYDAAPNIPNCRFYLFCKKEPSDKYRLSLSQLENEILPKGVNKIGDFTENELLKGEDKIKDQFVKYSYKRALWPGLIGLILFMALVLAVFQFIRVFIYHK